MRVFFLLFFISKWNFVIAMQPLLIASAPALRGSCGGATALHPAPSCAACGGSGMRTRCLGSPQRVQTETAPCRGTAGTGPRSSLQHHPPPKRQEKNVYCYQKERRHLQEAKGKTPTTRRACVISVSISPVTSMSGWPVLIQWARSRPIPGPLRIPTLLRPAATK